MVVVEARQLMDIGQAHIQVGQCIIAQLCSFAVVAARYCNAVQQKSTYALYEVLITLYEVLVFWFWSVSGYINSGGGSFLSPLSHYSY